MSATTNNGAFDYSRAEGFFKEIYGDIKNLAKPKTYLMDKVSFSEKDSVGDKFVEDVIVAKSHGVTYLNSGAGVSALAPIQSSATKKAYVQGSQIIMRDAMDFEMFYRASNEKKAFMNATSYFMQSLYEGTLFRAELNAIYGGSPIGKTEDAYDLSDDNTLQIQITDASWAIGVWVASEGMYVNFYNGSSIVGTAGVNPALGTADFKIASVDVTNKIITVSGDATVLATLEGLATTSGTSLSIYPKGAYGNEALGLDGICTASGTLFNINTQLWSAFKPNTYAVNGQLTMSKVLDSISVPYAKGLDTNATLLCSVNNWSKLNVELTGNRRYDGSYSRKGTNGFNSIEYYSINGNIEIVAHPMIKDGDAFLFALKDLKRIGATDITFNTPMNGIKNFFTIHPDYNSVQCGCYYHGAIFTSTPSRMTKLTGIVI